MLRVTGKAIIELNFVVELDVNSVSTQYMPISESDELIADAILDKYGQIVESITVKKIERLDTQCNDTVDSNCEIRKGNENEC